MEGTLRKMGWGLLGPETINSERRTRTLGLGAAVRSFNDLAVPGLGGVWFGKQLFLATLGVAIANRLRASGRRVQNIETANAIEALACVLALSENQWRRDARLRGALKLQGKTDFSFATVRKSSFYVTQPMRMSTVQPLRALGLVESIAERFNAFGCATLGERFLEEACFDFNPCYYSSSVPDHLFGWASGDHNNVTKSENLRKALSPLEALPLRAREFLHELMVGAQGRDGLRRRAAVEWMEALRQTKQASVLWKLKPDGIADDHWRDLHVGALFFTARDAAIALLDRVEEHLANSGEPRLTLSVPLPHSLSGEIQTLRKNARAFLNSDHNSTPDVLARTFCQECVVDGDANLIERLVNRDGRVLRAREGIILPGSGFRFRQAQELDAARSSEEGMTDIVVKQTIEWPVGISHRIQNLFMLNLDLNGELGGWLGNSQQVPEVNNEEG